MQFDHHPDRGEKTFGIARAYSTTFGKERVEAELKKCDLVCSNCHAVRTWTRRQNCTVAQQVEHLIVNQTVARSIRARTATLH